MLSRIEAGFPSPAEDYREDPLSLADLVQANPLSTFFVRVEHHELPARNIFFGDILLVDKSMLPDRWSVVLAIEDGEIRLKEMTPPGVEIEVWGVVTHTLRKMSYVCPRGL